MKRYAEMGKRCSIAEDGKKNWKKEHQIKVETEGTEMSSFTVCLIHECNWHHCSVLFLPRDLSKASFSISLCSPYIISESRFITASVSNPYDLVLCKAIVLYVPKNKLHQGTVTVKALKKQSGRNAMDVMENFLQSVTVMHSVLPS